MPDISGFDRLGPFAAIEHSPKIINAMRGCGIHTVEPHWV
jgi:hypothetical protein